MTRPSLAGIERGDHAWEVKCPTCGAAPGRPCYGNGEMPRHMTHGARAAVRLKALTAAVRDVLALHKPAPVYAHIDDCGHPDDGDHGIEGEQRDEYFCLDTPTGDVLCQGCGLDCDQEWPCPTIRALDAHLDLTDPEGDPT